MIHTIALRFSQSGNKAPVYHMEIKMEILPKPSLDLNMADAERCWRPSVRSLFSRAFLSSQPYSHFHPPYPPSPTPESLTDLGRGCLLTGICSVCPWALRSVACGRLATYPPILCWWQDKVRIWNLNSHPKSVSFRVWASYFSLKPTYSFLIYKIRRTLSLRIFIALMASSYSRFGDFTSLFLKVRQYAAQFDLLIYADHYLLSIASYSHLPEGQVTVSYTDAPGMR